MNMIAIGYGKDIAGTTVDVLRASDIGSFLKAEFSVSIKPNLVLSSPASSGATTHPEVVEGIIMFLREFGAKESKIKIIESSWVGDSTKRAFKACGYEALSKKYGIPLIDLKNDACLVLSHGKNKYEICGEAMNTDFLINVPVLKAHCQTRFTCCMKNLKGCIPDREKRRFHSQGLHKPIAEINALIKTGYCVVDGICGDLSFEEGGNPVEANRIIAGKNPLTVDSYCAELIGYAPDEIGYLVYGKSIGLGDYCSPETKIVELNAQNKPACKPGAFWAVNAHKNKIAEKSACSACYSALAYALHKTGGKTKSNAVIHIGQGYKGKSGEGAGIGNCAAGFSECVPGCPPKATDIAKFLVEY